MRHWPRRSQVALVDSNDRSRAVTWGLVCAAGSAIAFSAKAIFVKLAYAAAPIDAVTLLALRMAYAAPCYAVLLWWSGRGRPRWQPHALVRVVALGMLGYYLASLLDFMGLVYVSAALERMVLFLYPTMVVVIGAALQRRPISRVELWALLLSYAGIGAMMWHDLTVSGDVGATLLGCALVFASAVSYAIYLVGAQSLIAGVGSVRFTSAAILVSSACVGLQFAATRPLAQLAAPASVQLLALAMGLLSTVLPTLLLGAAIKRIGSSRTALVGSMGPVATIGLAAMLLDEPVSLLELLGAGLVLAGVVLVSRPVRAANAGGSDAPAAADTSATPDRDRVRDSARSSSPSRS